MFYFNSNDFKKNCYSGASLSNASTAWAISVLLIICILRVMYPEGVMAREYDGWGRKVPDGSVHPAGKLPSDALRTSEYASVPGSAPGSALDGRLENSDVPHSYEMVEHGASQPDGHNYGGRVRLEV